MRSDTGSTDGRARNDRASRRLRDLVADSRMDERLKGRLRRLMQKALTAKRIWAGPLRGRRIVTSWHDYPAAILGRTERHLLAWFEKNVNSGDTWLDIGAHYGYTAIALSRSVGPAGRVFAFEPMVRTAGCVIETRRSNDLAQLTVVPLGLGDPASLEMKQLASVRGMADSTSCDDTWRETVLVARLDWLWPQMCGSYEKIDGMKIDVQGMELEALRGMSVLLTRFKPKLVLEVHRHVARTELLDFLEAVGYSPRSVPIEPVEGEQEPLYVDNRSYAFHAR